MDRVESKLREARKHSQFPTRNGYHPSVPAPAAFHWDRQTLSKLCKSCEYFNEETINDPCLICNGCGRPLPGSDCKTEFRAPGGRIGDAVKRLKLATEHGHHPSVPALPGSDCKTEFRAPGGRIGDAVKRLKLAIGHGHHPSVPVLPGSDCKSEFRAPGGRSGYAVKRLKLATGHGHHPPVPAPAVSQDSQLLSRLCMKCQYFNAEKRGNPLLNCKCCRRTLVGSEYKPKFRASAQRKLKVAMQKSTQT